MGEHTQYITARYTASDPDALIEALRRVPSEYTLDLGPIDTERMVDLLDAATPGNGDHPGFLGLRPQLVDWLQRYEEHAHWKARTVGKGWPFTNWPAQYLKIFLVMLYAISHGAVDPMFTDTHRTFAHGMYTSILTTLDIELI